MQHYAIPRVQAHNPETRQGPRGAGTGPLPARTRQENGPQKAGPQLRPRRSAGRAGPSSGAGEAPVSAGRGRGASAARQGLAPGSRGAEVGGGGPSHGAAARYLRFQCPAAPSSEAAGAPAGGGSRSFCSAADRPRRGRANHRLRGRPHRSSPTRRRERYFRGPDLDRHRELGRNSRPYSARDAQALRTGRGCEPERRGAGSRLAAARALHFQFHPARSALCRPPRAGLPS